MVSLVTAVISGVDGASGIAVIVRVERCSLRYVHCEKHSSKNIKCEKKLDKQNKDHLL